MTVTRNILSPLNLETFGFWINDTDPNSRYFQLSQVPDVLTAGKNAFLINGSPQLVQSSPVKVELKDANGDVVFSQPIPNYIEGLARIVSIEIYSDTPEGMGTLTILGHLAEDANGNLPPTKELADGYNVRWQKKIPIAPRRPNITPVRLLAYPTASASEVLNPFRSAVQGMQVATQSVGETIQGNSLYNAIRIGDPLPNSYLVKSTLNPFTKQMEGGQFSWTIAGTPYTSSIKKVINDSTISIEPGVTSGSIYIPFTAAAYQVDYTGSPTYTVTEFTRSFADVNVKGLTTISGDIYRLKVYASSIDSPGNPELITDARVEAPELMVTASYLDGEHKLRTGYFTGQSIPDNYWIIGTFSADDTLYNPE